MKDVLVVVGFENLSTSDLKNIFPNIKFIRIGSNIDFELNRDVLSLCNSLKNIQNIYKEYSKAKIPISTLSFYDSEYYKKYLNKALIASSRGNYDRYNHPFSQTALETANACLNITFSEFDKFDLDKIKGFISSYPPHSVADWSAYYIVRWLGYDCFSFDLLPNSQRSLLYRNLLDSIEKRENPEKISIKINTDKYKQKTLDFRKSFIVGDFVIPDYMLKINHDIPNLSLNFYFFKKVFEILINQLKNKILKFLRLLKIIKRRIRDASPSPYSLGSLLQTLNKEIFSDYTFNFSYKNYLDKKAVDQIKKYVYLPLHVQPEASTEIRGNAFCDQLLFIKYIRKIIPSEWTILIKRNPIDKTPLPYMRHKGFWEFINSTENTFLVNTNIHTLSLTKNSIFVASVSGSACFEANLLAIPSIYGGHCIYGDSPLACNLSSLGSASNLLDWLKNLQSISKSKKYKLMKDYLAFLNSNSLPGSYHYGSTFNKSILKGWLSIILKHCRSSKDFNFL